MTHSGDTPGPGSPRPTPIYRDWTVLQLGALVLLLDQFTKYLVIQLLPFGFSFPREGLFRFTHVHNTGSAFGILQGLNTPLIFISFVGIVILVLIYRSQPRPSNWLRLSLGLQLGGAFGNLVDRLRLGYVTDFIDVGPWPVFNLADASIVTGLVLLAWVFLRPGRQDEPATVAEVSESQAHGESYQWCPVCDGEMVEVPDGWRCLDCGVKERIDLRNIAPVEDDDYSVQQTGRTAPSIDGRGMPYGSEQHNDGQASSSMNLPSDGPAQPSTAPEPDQTAADRQSGHR